MEAVLNRGDAVELARLLSDSPELIRAWCRPPEMEDEFSNGKFGPHARLRTLITMIKEDDGSPERAYPIAQYVASLLSGVFVPMPASSRTDDDALIRRIFDVMRETADAIEKSRAVWFDDETPGKITGDEGASCIKDIDEAIVALVQLRRWVDCHTSALRRDNAPSPGH